MNHHLVSRWWYLGIASVVLVAVVSGFIFFQRDVPAGDEPAISQKYPTAAAEEPMDWIGPLPQDVARLFTEATTHEQRMELIADPKRDGAIMKHFFQEGAGANEHVKEIISLGNTSTGQQALVNFQVNMEDGKRRLLAVKISETDAKVDFRCYARFGTESWEDLISGLTKISEEVRVFLEPSTSYMRNFSDDKEWISYIATTPDTEQIMYFYAPRNSEIAKQLSQAIGRRRIRATVAIRSHGEDHQHRQFEITGVLATGWVK